MRCEGGVDHCVLRGWVCLTYRSQQLNAAAHVKLLCILHTLNEEGTERGGG
jgi:hypothetical protein